MPSSDIVVVGIPLSRFNYQPVQYFRLNYLAFIPENFPQGVTVRDIITQNAKNGIDSDTVFKKNDDIPETRISEPASTDIVVTASRANTLATLLANAQNAKGYREALRELSAAGVTWDIKIVKSYADAGQPATTAQAVTRGIPAAAVPKDGKYPPGTKLTTYIPESSLADGGSLRELLTHELGHVTRDSSGALNIDENAVVGFTGAAVRAIYLGPTASADGSSTSSLVLQGGTGTNLVFAPQGNAIITTGDSASTVVTYDYNQYVQTGAGNDYVQVLGTGAKYLKDTGGVNTLYIGWTTDPINKMLKDYTDNKAGQIIGRVILSPVTAGVQPGDNSTRIVIEDFQRAGYKTLAWTDASGVKRSMNFASLFNASGPQLVSPSALSRSTGAAESQFVEYQDRSDLSYHSSSNPLVTIKNADNKIGVENEDYADAFAKAMEPSVAAAQPVKNLSSIARHASLLTEQIARYGAAGTFDSGRTTGEARELSQLFAGHRSAIYGGRMNLV